MRFIIKKVVPLKPRTSPSNDVVPQAEFTLRDKLTSKEVRVVWPHDASLTEGSLLPQNLEPAVLVMFRELFENPINEQFSMGVKLTNEQLDAFDKLKAANPPVPLYLVICMSGEPCTMPIENFGDITIGHTFRIDAQSVADRLDKTFIKGIGLYLDDHPKPAMCGPHRVIPFCPVIEDNIHAEAQRSGSGETAPG